MSEIITFEEWIYEARKIAPKWHYQKCFYDDNLEYWKSFFEDRFTPEGAILEDINLRIYED